MALNLPSLSDTFKVVLRSPIESAVTCSSDEYKQYLETLDESYLKLQSEPTRFVMRKVLPAVAFAEVQNAQFQMVGNEMKVQMAFAQKEVQVSIIAIENPGDMPPDQRLEFRKAQGLGGGLHDDILAQLCAVGVIMDLYTARQTALGVSGQNTAKKK